MGRKVLVGFLLLGGLFIFGLATFYVENWQDFLGKGYYLRARFPLAQTLDKGDIVRLAGVPIGAVRSLSVNTEIETDYPVEAELWIRTGIKIRTNDRAMIKMSSLFGGYYVSIERGPGDAPELGEGGIIEDTGVAPSITEVVESSTETLDKISAAFDEVTTIMDELTEGEGTLAMLLRDEELAADLKGTVADIKEAAGGIKVAAERIEKGEGLLGEFLMDDQLAEDFRVLVADVKETAASLKSASAELDSGQGTLPRLLRDEEMYNELKDAVATIGDAARMFQEGEGLLPQLLQDKEMAQDLKDTMADARQAASDIKEFTADLSGDEGTLVKLMKDDKLYRQLTQIAEDLQAMLDTYREQSPVISFAGAVFGAF